MYRTNPSDTKKQVSELQTIRDIFDRFNYKELSPRIIQWLQAHIAKGEQLKFLNPRLYYDYVLNTLPYRGAKDR